MAALAILLGLAAAWQVYQRPLLSPALPAGIMYSGPLMLFGEPQQAPRLDADEPPPASATTKGMHITRPVWADLSSEQQTLLAGLEPIWPFISNAEKRRWLAIVKQSRGLDEPAQQRLIEHITIWGHLSENQRLLVRQQYRGWEETELLQLTQAWQDFNALDPAERTRLAKAAHEAANPSARPAPRRRSNLVRIPAANQTQPGLSNLPKIPLQPVRYTQQASAATPDSEAAVASRVAPVQASSVAGGETSSPPAPTPAPRVTYWHGIPITPPPAAPIYAN